MRASIFLLLLLVSCSATTLDNTDISYPDKSGVDFSHCKDVAFVDAGSDVIACYFPNATAELLHVREHPDLKLCEAYFGGNPLESCTADLTERCETSWNTEDCSQAGMFCDWALQNCVVTVAVANDDPSICTDYYESVEAASSCYLVASEEAEDQSFCEPLRELLDYDEDEIYDFSQDISYFTCYNWAVGWNRCFGPECPEDSEDGVLTHEELCVELSGDEQILCYLYEYWDNPYRDFICGKLFEENSKPYVECTINIAVNEMDEDVCENIEWGTEHLLREYRSTDLYDDYEYCVFRANEREEKFWEEEYGRYS